MHDGSDGDAQSRSGFPGIGVCCRFRLAIDRHQRRRALVASCQTSRNHHNPVTHAGNNAQRDIAVLRCLLPSLFPGAFSMKEHIRCGVDAPGNVGVATTTPTCWMPVRLFQHPHERHSRRRDPGLSCSRAGTRHLASIGIGRALAARCRSATTRDMREKTDLALSQDDDANDRVPRRVARGAMPGMQGEAAGRHLEAEILARARCRLRLGPEQGAQIELADAG